MAFTGIRKSYRCCPLDSDDLPQPPGNLLIFVLQGYNYRKIPQWFSSDGRNMIPLQFNVDTDHMLHRWTFYKKLGDVCNMEWYLVTSDNIVPNIYEWISDRDMKVERILNKFGHTYWKISC